MCCVVRSGPNTASNWYALALRPPSEGTCSARCDSSMSSIGLAPGSPSIDGMTGRTRTQTCTRVLPARGSDRRTGFVRGGDVGGVLARSGSGSGSGSWTTGGGL